MEHNPEREIKEMDEKIDELHSVVSDLGGAVKSEFIEKIEAVIEEWTDYTKKCIEGLVEALENATDDA